MIEKRDGHETKDKFSNASQGSVCVVRKTQERNRLASDFTKVVTSSSPVPLKTCRVGVRCTLNMSRPQTSSCWSDVVVKRDQLKRHPRHLTMAQNYEVGLQMSSCR
ncbi:hypothetical protein TNCV_2481071 [Trichonephila clavipes]|nr:hypothetical protein TNCV_2481071 [Trichonephila clavipes]